MSAREGKFWKSRLESITNEYKKWREISRKQIKTNNESSLINSNPESAKTSSGIPISNNYQPLKKQISNLNISGTTGSKSSCGDENKILNISENIQNNNNNIDNNLNSNNTISNNIITFNTNHQSPTIISGLNSAPYINVFESHNLTSNNSENVYYATNNMNNLNNINNSSNVTILTNFTYVPNSNTNNNFNSNTSNIAVNNSYFMASNSQATQIPYIATNNNNYQQQNHQIYTNVNPTTNNQPSQSSSSGVIYNKQAPYNNRYPSPSPGLFQDIDLYNFSSDTLFSTYLAEDPKDNMFGTNPDFFQPDLMHLYPNFDFFDLYDPNELKNEPESALKPLNNQTIQSQTVINNINNKTNNNNSNKTNFLNSGKQKQIASKNTEQTLQTQEITKQQHIQQPQQVIHSDQIEPPISQTVVSIDYIDLSNFNTLATVAAAQPSSHPNDLNAQDIEINLNKKKLNLPLKDGAQDSLKMPASLSQINSSINRQASANIAQHQQNEVLTTINSENENSKDINNSGQLSNSTIRNLLALNTSIITNSQLCQNIQKQDINNESSPSSLMSIKKLNKNSSNILDCNFSVFFVIFT
jgi:hypothetical protein